ncbi:hypothetical protein [Halobellus rubicundus]|uniref:DUF8173 domain-containing protein n=1 Tax=Halobellus rubicundus TaxID=2996466 RepID=A0ABD5MGT7_9EURY
MTYAAAVIVGVTAQIGDPSALFGLSGPAYAGLSFVAVLVVGAGLLARRRAFVDRAIDRVASDSVVSILYGVVPFALVGFIGGYVLSQAARVGVGSAAMVQGWVLVVGLVGVGFAGLGYLVVGAYLTQIEGSRRPWHGAVVGSVLSAIPWLLLPTLPALLVWFLGASVGLGAPTRRWVHGARTVESEAAD